jgi:anti-repressor protein
MAILGLHRRALSRLDEDEKGARSTHTLGGEQSVSVVNEPGLYALTLGSRKPEAKAFKRWVTHEVLPSIRRTGRYQQSPQDYATALRALASEVEAREKERPMVEFYHTVAASADTLSLNDAAKLLGLGRNRLMRKMRESGILNANNVPYQAYLERKLFRVTEQHWTDREGKAHIQKTTRVYQRGIEFLRRKFCGNQLAIA